PSTRPPATPTSTLSLHDALPICQQRIEVLPGAQRQGRLPNDVDVGVGESRVADAAHDDYRLSVMQEKCLRPLGKRNAVDRRPGTDRKSTRLNSSHGSISYAVFCL